MSEERSRASHHVEDLSVLSRRGALSAADQRAFADALEASASLATAHQLGLDFDQIATVKPGDDALIAEVASRSVSRGRARAWGRFRKQALLLVAALAVAGSATAWWQRERAPARTVAAQLKPRESATPIRGSLQPAILAPEAEAAPGNAPRQAVAPPSALGGAKRLPETRVDQSSARTFDSAEALFREANAARRSGAVAIARALYLRLEHDFPASDEAHVAHLSLGNLLLTTGRAGEAEQQFAAYLGGRPALAQEALVGRAQSLAALGRGSEERAVWESLLHDYPASLYAARAKQRLLDLGAAPTDPR